ncbi:thiosulfate sulfurtransferase (rhodanese)-like domain-containing protein 2 [Phytophthora pseudosyringae]|uniref:Thiosulfate sulfurtransferase (Rhodanese)-like domain-containing protein 2 n=1 Tax=Phytophthora pseudosyringae TaxID=221518 RepID=A0A8T1WAV4_9STRA|nr:thiosulfate sulfurtransferase (rhodanese)-like domain-containing protein 2 [Phytophthora pseudosyringae]
MPPVSRWGTAETKVEQRQDQTMETTETKWRRERLELYEKLERSAQNGLNREAVLASRELFDFDASGRAAPKEFVFQHEDDAVTVVCAEIPQAAARQCGRTTRSVMNALSLQDDATNVTAETSVKDVYVSDPGLLHVTLFYTSHPDDLAPTSASERKSERLSREISLLRGLATQFEPIRMVPVKVVLASSGAILMLFQCIHGDRRRGHERGRASNAGSRAEFGVDLLRQGARETFPFVSKKSPSAIIHTTLARVMAPDAFDEAALTRAREACHRISQQLASAAELDGNGFVVDTLCFGLQAENEMRSPECTEQEAQWRQQRAELYEELYAGGKKALDREGVRATRQNFTAGATLESKPYLFPTENDGVALICAPIPLEMAERCHAVGKELTDLLPREPETSNAVACVTRRELMHITLFHTSHPGDLAPNARLRFPQDVAQLQTMCTRFAPFCMTPVKVLMASSGAIVMLFLCLPPTERLGDDVVNAHAEFSVDHIRRVAKETFSYSPKTDTRVIIHSTLGRVLSPEVSDADLDRLRARCDEITAELAADPRPALFDKLWFVEETHNLSPQGLKTEVPLLGGVQQ